MDENASMQTTPTQVGQTEPRTSGLAIASAVMGLISISGFAAAIGLQHSDLGAIGIVGGPFVGLPLGIGALLAINKQPGRLKGKGWAICGICLSVPFLVLLCLACVLLLVHYGMPGYADEVRALLSGHRPVLEPADHGSLNDALGLVALGLTVFLYAIGWRRPESPKHWRGLLADRRPWIAIGLLAMTAGLLVAGHIVLTCTPTK
jgi:hypothetical protein